jgi:hypothetical protein
MIRPDLSFVWRVRSWIDFRFNGFNSWIEEKDMGSKLEILVNVLCEEYSGNKVAGYNKKSCIQYLIYKLVLQENN